MLPAGGINAAFAIEKAMVGRIRRHKKTMTDEQVMIGLFQRIECRNDAWFSKCPFCWGSPSFLVHKYGFFHVLVLLIFFLSSLHYPTR